VKEESHRNIRIFLLLYGEYLFTNSSLILKVRVKYKTKKRKRRAFSFNALYLPFVY